MAPSTAPACAHPSICSTSSRHAKQAGFQRPDKQQRLAATKVTGVPVQKKSDLSTEVNPNTFPAPLVLPGDDLSEDPECPPQSFQDWLDEEERNPVTAKRRAIYVVPPPQIDDEVDFMHSWSKPQGHEQNSQTQLPGSHDVGDYLAAFYHGLPVKVLPPSTLGFVAWQMEKKPSQAARKSGRSRYVGLTTPSECVRIRARASPDGVFIRQLNLDDLLDAAISMLPHDAYALLFLVHHDIYEDEDDEFACGRAYGGSRVAVVSSARYNPDLDDMAEIDRLHAWPASHCQDYISMRQKIRPKATKTKQAHEQSGSSASQAGPLEAAISVYRSFPASQLSSSSLSTLWVGRVCRTVSHELGHCFGLDHCVYYACAMQGTASLREDARQPPYLCPVDLAKLLNVTSVTASQRYRALLAFCERPENKATHFFAPFAAWIRGRLVEMDFVSP